MGHHTWTASILETAQTEATARLQLMLQHTWSPATLLGKTNATDILLFDWTQSHSLKITESMNSVHLLSGISTSSLSNYTGLLCNKKNCCMHASIKTSATKNYGAPALQRIAKTEVCSSSRMKSCILKEAEQIPTGFQLFSPSLLKAFKYINIIKYRIVLISKNIYTSMKIFFSSHDVWHTIEYKVTNLCQWHWQMTWATRLLHTHHYIILQVDRETDSMYLNASL